MRPHRGVVLIHPVIIHKHARRPNVGFLTHRGVTNIGQMRHLRTRTNLGVLRLHETTQLAPLTQHRARADKRERAHRGPRPNLRITPVGAHHLGAFPHNHVRQCGIRANHRIIGNHRRTMQLRIRVNNHILTHPNIHINPRGGRINDRRPIHHGGLHRAMIQLPSGLRQLHPIIHPGNLLGVSNSEPPHRMPTTTSNRQHIRQIQLPLGIIGVKLPQCLTQHISVKRKHARIHLGDCQRFLIRILLLHNGHNLTLPVANNPTIAGRVGNIRSQHGHRGRHGRVGVDKPLQSGGPQKRHIRIRHHNRAGKIRQLIHGALHGMTRTILLLLNGRTHRHRQLLGNLSHRRPHLLPTMPNDRHNLLGGNSCRRMQRVR